MINFIYLFILSLGCLYNRKNFEIIIELRAWREILFYYYYYYYSNKQEVLINY